MLVPIQLVFMTNKPPYRAPQIVTISFSGESAEADGTPTLGDARVEMSYFSGGERVILKRATLSAAIGMYESDMQAYNAIPKV